MIPQKKGRNRVQLHMVFVGMPLPARFFPVCRAEIMTEDVKKPSSGPIHHFTAPMQQAAGGHDSVVEEKELLFGTTEDGLHPRSDWPPT